MVDLRIRTLAVDASGNAVRNTFDYAIEAQSGGDTVAPQASTSPAAGTYSTAQQVTLSVTDETDKAPKLYYTLDGSAPQAVASSLYKAGTVLPIAATTLVRTLSVDAAGNQRPQEFKFTISSDTQANSRRADDIMTLRPTVDPGRVRVKAWLNSTVPPQGHPLSRV